jgi:chromosome segregation ATPase
MCSRVLELILVWRAAARRAKLFPELAKELKKSRKDHEIAVQRANAHFRNVSGCQKRAADAERRAADAQHRAAALERNAGQATRRADACDRFNEKLRSRAASLTDGLKAANEKNAALKEEVLELKKDLRARDQELRRETALRKAAQADLLDRERLLAWQQANCPKKWQGWLADLGRRPKRLRPEGYN